MQQADLPLNKDRPNALHFKLANPEMVSEKSTKATLSDTQHLMQDLSNADTATCRSDR